MIGMEQAFHQVLNRLAYAGDGEAFLSFDDVNLFDATALENLQKLGVLKPVADARVAICDGCDVGCAMNVEFFRDSTHPKIKALIVCDKDKDIGVVAVPLERLKRWQVSERLIAEMVRDLLGNTQSVAKDNALWRLGMVDGGQHKAQVSLKFDRDALVLASGHSVLLMELLSFNKNVLKIDLKKIKKMVNEPTGFSDDVESTKARNARMLKRRNELKSQGVRAFNKIIAIEENVSASTVKNAIISAEKEQKAQSNPKSSNKFKNLIPTQSSQSKK